MDLFRPQQSPPAQNQGDVPGNSLPIESTSSPSASALFREIHKNAWLRKLPTSDKRSGIVSKKGEPVWAVFCVHDDVHPLLELYADQKVAATHRPDWFVSLSSTLHVSPTIVAHDQEYEFVITLPSDVVRLTAPSWDMMMEWVDTIRSKLRELRILCPRENVYSRMPEPRLPLLPTRDPNSPLPPPPMGPSALVPGMEPVHLETADAVPAVSTTSSNSTNTQSQHLSRNMGDVVVVPTTGSHSEPQGSSRLQTTSHSENQHPRASSRSPGPSSSMSSRSPGPSIASLLGRSQAPNNVVNPRSPLPSRASTRQASLNSRSPGPTGVVPSRNITSPSCTSAFASSNPTSPEPNSSGSQNVTVIEVEDSRQTPCDIFNFNFIRDSLPPVEAEEDVGDQFFTPPATPRIRTGALSSAETPTMVSVEPPSATSPPPSRIWQQLTQVVSNLIGQASSTNSSSVESEVIRVNQGVTNIMIPSLPESANDSPANSSVYEHVYPTNGGEINPAVSEEHRQRPVVRQGSTLAETSHIEPQRRRRRTSSGSEVLSPRVRGPSNGQRHPEGERRLHPAPHPFRQSNVGVELVGGAGPRVTLREQQVQQLRKEMLHPGGVRLQLRRKDCINSIAFIDAFGAVWVAGWKQREHPMLYNALHIGDQVLTAGGLPVQCAADAHRFIRACTSLYVEFVVRRVPYGRVFAFRRDAEGQSLGITTEGGTAEIREVVPHSPAARGGLTARAPTCDGLSLTPWVLTEVNGRPLNLFFKDGEVRDRLNAVGKEISVLVQPFDLVKQIKKQLKAVRGYKDYIVQ